MIISASRRTDIPAFYSEWLFNRIKDGYVMTRNPMNRGQISRVSLNPEAVDCFVFWTKNPENMFKKLDILDQMQYNYYFQFTLNPYGKDIEPNVPTKKRLIPSFQYLSDKIGKNRVIWRYDPILLTDKITNDYHIKYFEYLAKNLHSHTDKCIISFVDFYKKSQRNLKALKPLDMNTDIIRSLSRSIYDIAETYGLALETCAEAVELSEIGIPRGKCVDDILISKICRGEIELGKDKTQRELCRCVSSIDIGAYNTCKHHCLYCYANLNHKIVRKNSLLHNPNSPLLVGELENSDKIYDRKMKRCIKSGLIGI